MILSLNPQQFLAVYNSVTINSSLTSQEVKSKMELILLDALSQIDDSKNQNKFDHWIKQEKEKVSSLENELKMIKLSKSPLEISSDDGLPYRPVV